MNYIEVSRIKCNRVRCNKHYFDELHRVVSRIKCNRVRCNKHYSDEYFTGWKVYMFTMYVATYICQFIPIYAFLQQRYLGGE